MIAGLLRRRRVELRLLVPALLAAGALWGFAELTDDVIEGDTHAFDRALVLALRTDGDPADPLGPRWVEEMARDFTALGGLGVLTLLDVAVVSFLWMLGRRRTAVSVGAAAFGGIALALALKQGFDRPRPELVPHLTEVYTSSFPSGHSMMSAATYLTLGALLARVQARRRVQVLLIGLALAITGLVGATRVYLGVHWPTDVLGGWAAGAAWALACWVLTDRLMRRGRLERAQDT